MLLYLRAWNNLAVLRNSTEHAETLFIALMENMILTSYLVSPSLSLAYIDMLQVFEWSRGAS